MGQHMDRLKQMLGAMGERVGRVDDFVQGSVRDHILRLPNDGSKLPEDAKMRALRHQLGINMHADRNPDSSSFYRVGNERGDQIGAGLARAAQAGGLAGVTAAGAALMNTGEQIKGASKPQFEPLPITERDEMVMQDVVRGLEDGSLSEIELNKAAKNGAFTKPQLALISDVYDFSRLGQEHYPFGDMTIMEAIHS